MYIFDDDLFHCESRTIVKPPKGYEWKVIFDPTRIGDCPGLFFGHYFRIFDIRPCPGEPPSWPDGIVFQHIDNGEKLSFKNGKLIGKLIGEENHDFLSLG